MMPPGPVASTAKTGALESASEQAQVTGSIAAASAKRAGVSAGPLIQAGSFKNKENAERARTVLSMIAPVDIAEIAVGTDVFFRVRVGPFANVAQAKAALPKVTRAGYRGAKVVTN
ncbi:MAG TPA: SPOR domain-containing protein [Methyloceanibacter sp.]|nr:SPOR domain-containing protein [Methyloceanibacter sp.]